MVIMTLYCIGINHRTAPVALREQLAVPGQKEALVLAKLQGLLNVEEVVLLNTCNRLEVYLSASEPYVDGAKILLTVAKVVADGDIRVEEAHLERSVQVYRDRDCIHHLFRVAGSLDSQVIGETEIVGQVKRAYQQAQKTGTVGKRLSKAFQKGLHVSKQVRTRSGIGHYSTSVGAVAVDLACTIFDGDWSEKAVLIVGAGKISETTLRHLSKKGAKNILIANRSFERAQELADRFEGRAFRFEQLPEALSQADIVVSSTGASYPILTEANLLPAFKQGGKRSLFLIDLALPRDIDTEVQNVSGIYVYNLDQLNEIANENRKRRENEATECERLVTEFVGKYWNEGQSVPKRKAPVEPYALPAFQYCCHAVCEPLRANSAAKRWAH